MSPFLSGTIFHFSPNSLTLLQVLKQKVEIARIPAVWEALVPHFSACPFWVSTPGKCFTHPVAILLLPGDWNSRNIWNVRNITCCLWELLLSVGVGVQGLLDPPLQGSTRSSQLSFSLGKREKEEKGSCPSLGKESSGTSSTEICPAQRCRITKYPELEVSHRGHN